jgi:hypothetical protein
VELYVYSPYAFMAQTETTLYNMILLALLIQDDVNYWVDIECKYMIKNKWSYISTSPNPSCHIEEQCYIRGY